MDQKRGEIEERKDFKSLKLSKETIVERTKKWLQSDDIFKTPVSYIFNRYSEAEKAILIREKQVCQQISKIVSDIKSFPLENDISFLPSYYVKEDDDAPI